MKDQIRVIIEKDGKVSFEVENVHGPKCVAMTEAFEKEIGGIVDRQKTSDFYTSAKSIVKTHVANRHGS